MISYSLGTMVQFIGYHDASEPIFHPGDLLWIAEVEADGVLRCFRFDSRSRLASTESDVVFAEEVRPITAMRVPIRRFPLPWGDFNNEKDGPCI